jgi:hypothetical protein
MKTYVTERVVTGIGGKDQAGRCAAHRSNGANYRWIRGIALLSLLVGSAGSAAAGSNPLADQVRTANDRFKDVSAAVAEGYAPIPWASGVQGGAMGIHYVNGDYLKDGAIDLTKPEAVMYEPMPDGKLMLVAVEYISRSRDPPRWKASCSASTARRTVTVWTHSTNCMCGRGSRTRQAPSRTTIPMCRATQRRQANRRPAPQTSLRRAGVEIRSKLRSHQSGLCLSSAASAAEREPPF